MARDYRHGHSDNKQAYQRKSQAQVYSQNQNARQPVEKRSVSLVWGAGFLVSAILLVGFFITQHFVSQGAKSDTPAENSIFQATATAVEQVDTTVANVATLPGAASQAASEPQSGNVSIPENKAQVVGGDVEKATSNVTAKVEDAIKPSPPVDNRILMVPPEAIPTVSAVVPSQLETKNHYTFYQGLTQTEVVVDAVPLSVKLDEPYYIVGGSFPTVEIAKSEQQRLAKVGQVLQVIQSSRDTKVYYRLRKGPYTDRLEMNKQRNELRQLGVDTLLIKATK